MSRLAQPGLVKRVVSAGFNNCPAIGAMAAADEIEAYTLPQGALSQLCRDMAAGRPGLLTRTGLHTFVDPRLGGGKQSPRTTEDLVELVTLHGEEYLFYRAQPIDLAVIRGTTADERGNVTMEDEPYFGEQLSIAQAARNRGATVVCQVSRIAAAGSLPGKQVKVPGALVDYLVVVPDEWQTYVTRYDAAYAGAIRRPDAGLARLPLDIRKVIARRAALELFPGAIVNLGFGVSNGIAPVAAEEGIHRDVTLTVEQGIVGGVPAGGNDAGAGHNYEAMVDQPYQFDFYDGGGLDVAFLSFAEVDAEGNVNVSRFGRVVNGPGGFVNISQGARKVVFSGTLTADGLEIVPDGAGGVRLVREGRTAKWVPAVQQITFSGRYARARGQQVMYVTDRAVFRLGADGIEVVEVAPGADLERDVLARIGFPVRVPAPPRPMDPRLFRPEPMGILAEFRWPAVTPPEEAPRAMSEPELVRVTVEAGVAVLTLDNPPLNLVTLELTRRLRAALDRLAADPEARILVVTGAGPRAFCAGSDVSEFPSVAGRRGAEEARAGERGVQPAGRLSEADDRRAQRARLRRRARAGGLLRHPDRGRGRAAGPAGGEAGRAARERRDRARAAPGGRGPRQGADVHGRPDRRGDRPELGAGQPRGPGGTGAGRGPRARAHAGGAAEPRAPAHQGGRGSRPGHDRGRRRPPDARPVRDGLPHGGRPRGRSRLLRQGAPALAPPVASTRRSPGARPRRAGRACLSARRRPISRGGTPA